MTCGRRTVSGLMLVLVLVVGLPAFAQDNADKPDPGQIDPAEMEKIWKEYATPGEEHAQFKRLVGEWTTETKSFYPDPNNSKVEKGTATYRLLLGGRFLQHRFNGRMEGQRFQGLGLIGYDKAKKKYVGTWIDTMGTGMLHTEGEYDDTGHKLVEVGTATTPLGEMKFKMVSDYQTEDKFLFTMYLLQGDTEQKMMEITYTRQAPQAKNPDNAKPAGQRKRAQEKPSKEAKPSREKAAK